MMTAIPDGRRALATYEETALLEAIHDLANRLGADTETVANELRELVERQELFRALRENFDKRS